MSFETAIKEYGLLGIIRNFVCIVKGHDYHIGRVCLWCDKPKVK